MKRHFKRLKVHGFTLIEITLVIIVMGILAAAIAPMLGGVVGRAQADAERAKLRTLKEALLADALERGGFVDPLTTATVLAANTPNSFVAVQVDRYLPASANALALGLPLTSGFNSNRGDTLAPNAVAQYFDGRPSSFLYDVRAGLTRTVAGIAATPLDFCTNASIAMQTEAVPYWCQRAHGREPTVTACQITATPPDQRVGAAMVLVSRGKNRQFEFENLEDYNATGTDPLTPTTVPPEDIPRTYESPSRGVNYTSETNAYYDDIVESISLSEVVNACQKRGIFTSPCSLGERQVRLVNSSAAAIGYRLNGGACTALVANTEIPVACANGTQDIAVNLGADCSGAELLNPTTRLAADANGDGTAVVVCSAAACTPN
jgi:prepilin-type N-terminal cleavage/methylation domain-containing protein